MPIKIEYMGQAPRAPQAFKFNGGEVNVKVDLLHNVLARSLRRIEQGGAQPKIRVHARLHSSDDIMELMMVKDALDREFPFFDKILHMPYVPYGRQDRVMQSGEALSIKVFANMINSMNFQRVSTLDNHSAVTTALIDRCESHSVLEVIRETFLDSRLFQPDTAYVLLCPDAGAMKKTLDVAKYYGGLRVINCDKQRDTATGEITGTYVNWGHSMSGMKLLIVDDICDGGRTFIEIAKAVKKFKPESIELLVSHGIFSKGLTPLLDSGISHLYTTDSFPQEVDSRLTVVPL